MRHLFELPDRPVYLNGASRSPNLKCVREEGQRAVAEKTLPWTIPESTELVAKVKDMYSTLLGVHSNTISLTGSTSAALSNVSRNLHLNPTESILVLESQNHSNVMPWQALVKRCPGSSLVVVPRPRDFDWTSAVLSTISNYNVKIVALPQCHWSDGSMLDIEKIALRCRKFPKITLILDLTQSIGVIPFNNSYVSADIIACSTHKWLLGPYGFCLLYIAPKWIPLFEPDSFHDRNRKPPTGLTAKQKDSFFTEGGMMLGGNLGYTEEYMVGARKFDTGGRPNPIGVPMLHAALRVVTSLQEPSSDCIARYCQPKTAKLAAYARSLGFRVPTWHAPHIVGLRVPLSERNLRTQFPNLSNIVSWLKEKEGISVSFRMKAIRVCVHIYNTEEEIQYFCEALLRAFVACGGVPENNKKCTKTNRSAL